MKTFILNMALRKDRRANIEREFANKLFFEREFVTPVTNADPCVSHWQTLQLVVERAKRERLQNFLFCEDDHVFTSDFDERRFTSLVEEADTLEADLLLGSVSWMQSPLQVSDGLFWLNLFNGIQFAVVFSRFYDRILNYNKKGRPIITEIALSNLSEKIFTAYPFMSVQKEFGYSDVTARNNQKGYVEGLFKNTSRKLEILNKVRTFYRTQCLQ